MDTRRRPGAAATARRRSGRTRAQRAAAAAAVGPAAHALRADRGASRPTSWSRSTSPRCASCPSSAWTSSTPDAREVLRAAGAETSSRIRSASGSTRTWSPSGSRRRRRRSRCTPATRRTTCRSAATGWRSGRSAARPNVSDLDRGRRIGNRADYQNLMRLAQMLNTVHFLAGYPVEPVDLHHGVRHLHATHDALTLVDKAIHCYSLGRQRNIDVLEMVRIARGIEDADPRRRAVGVHRRELELAAPARHADAPGDHGLRRRATRSCASRRSRWPGRWRR